MTARWLAQQIDAPLVTMNLSAVVSSFLGNSGKNIRSVLNYASSGQCILFLDEFDAIAKRRDDDTDIGELKRVVSVILMELDRWASSSLWSRPRTTFSFLTLRLADVLTDTSALSCQDSWNVNGYSRILLLSRERSVRGSCPSWRR